MGEHHVAHVQDETASNQFMQHLLRDLQALEQMLDQGLIESGVRRIGAEQELFLIDKHGRPAPIATDLLADTTDPHLTTELGRFNLELNLDPLPFEGGCLHMLEADINQRVGHVQALAQNHEARALLVGILPTLQLSDLSLDNMTPAERYHVLNERLTMLRKGAYRIHLQGIDELHIKHDSVMLEASITSFQVHLQVDPGSFVEAYNIAQAITAPVLAAAVNAPLLLGRRLWRETRIGVFQQSIDTRRNDLGPREITPRVTFGNRWAQGSVMDLFRENVVRFRAVVGKEVDEDPFEVLAMGGAPRLRALQVHNGTVYRWNRPCYGVTDGRPHLRIENRVIPSGPTPADEVANAAFWLGLMRGLSTLYGDVTEMMDFSDARSNFIRAARMGLDAQLHWFGGRAVAVRDLILQELLPVAHDGLRLAGLHPVDIEHYLGIIEARVISRRTGAWWQLTSLDHLRGDEAPSRHVHTLVQAMARRQAQGKPVHTWEPATLEEGGELQPEGLSVGQCMSTDLFTVKEHEPVALAASVMEWRNVRHILVEDDRQRLVGLVSLRALLRVLLRPGGADLDLPVRDVMIPDPVTTTPEASAMAALHLMREKNFGALPVVRGKRLVGIVTERDFMAVAARLMALV